MNPDANFLPISPISSPPSGADSVLLIHQISGFPDGAAIMVKQDVTVSINKFKGNVCYLDGTILIYLIQVCTAKNIFFEKIDIYFKVKGFSTFEQNLR